MSCSPDSRAQIPAAAAVAGGVQDRKACGGTPSMPAARPLITTWPPPTASTARTPVSPLMALTCAVVRPAGSTANRSGTTSWRGGEPDTERAATPPPCSAGAEPGATSASGRLARIYPTFTVPVAIAVGTAAPSATSAAPTAAYRSRINTAAPR